MSEKKHPGHYVDVVFPKLPQLPSLPSLPGLPSLPTFNIPDYTMPARGILDDTLEAAERDMSKMIAEKVRAAVRMRDALVAEEEQKDAAELPAILAEAEREREKRDRRRIVELLQLPESLVRVANEHTWARWREAVMKQWEVACLAGEIIDEAEAACGW